MIPVTKPFLPPREEYNQYLLQRPSTGKQDIGDLSFGGQWTTFNIHYQPQITNQLFTS
jgi:hypothetical protein